MPIRNLKPGNYIVAFTNDGYETLSAEILVSSSGVTCIKVTGGSCGSTTPPGVNITSPWLVFGTLKPKEAPPPPPPPAKGYLSISSAPLGASVDVNGIGIGRTPVTRHELTTGSKLVTLRLSGYKPEEKGVTILENETADLFVSLSAIAPSEEGFLTVTSVPTGASVSLGGVSIGSTPITAYGLPAGAKVVSVSLSGYATATRDVTIVAGETFPIAVTLGEAVVPTTIGGWIDEVGVTALTRDHWLYAYYLSIGATDLAAINYPNLVPKPSPMATELATRENWLALYYYSIGATDLGNLNTGCNY